MNKFTFEKHLTKNVFGQQDNKIKKLEKLCSDFRTCTKKTMPFLKKNSKTIYCL